MEDFAAVTRLAGDAQLVAAVRAPDDEPKTGQAMKARLIAQVRRAPDFTGEG